MYTAIHFSDAKHYFFVSFEFANINTGITDCLLHYRQGEIQS